MANQKLINVALDKDLVQQLLAGLYNGAKAKALKVVISTDGEYHVESKELKMVIEVGEGFVGMKAIRINNEKQASYISAEVIERVGLTKLATDVVRELRERYSPVFHSLADNIVVFSRAYGGSN